MKKTILLVSIALLGICSVLAQNVDRSSFKAGFNAGLPVADASEISSFSIGLDLNYHWGVSKTFDVGLAAGFINSFSEEEFEDFQFLPVAGSVRIYPTYEFKFGADAGYAIGINDGNEGGFYYRPIIGYNITGNTELNVSYTAIENNGTFGLVMAGILFLF